MRRRAALGFTLIEVVVALSLVAVLMVGLVSALVTFGNTGSRLEQRALKSDDIRLVHAFLRQSLAAASALQHIREGDQVRTVWLSGDDRQVEWLGLMPARHGAGGLYHLKLHLARGADDRDLLLLDYRPYVADEESADWSAAGRHELIDGELAIRIEYLRAGDEAWQSFWDDPMVLPVLVRIGVERDGEVWPDLTTRILAAEPGVQMRGQRERRR